MSIELRQKLQFLEADYRDQPPLAQRADLVEMNRIREILGLSLVDEKLREISTPAPTPNVSTPTSVDANDPHREAREIYAAFLTKREELQRHQEYADRVAKATAGRGRTPVKPLATMGTNGGALLCDYCRKPMILEGGGYHGVYADAAWKLNPKDNWVSYISGGMVVEILTNGTLRIYHGYQHGPQHCCNKASAEREKEREAFDSSPFNEKRPLLLAFLEHEFPKMPRSELFDLLTNIFDTLFAYDPGIGVNRPTTS